MATENTKDQWFASWFDTPYYHILYKDRDHEEAARFMRLLTQSLELEPEAHILDLACGRGRHSIFLNTLGYWVSGVDLSENSIAFAQRLLQDYGNQEKAELQQSSLPTGNTSPDLKPVDPSRIHFAVHDMTQALDQRFDAVFNLFTSFGYFDDESDNLKTIQAIKEELKPDACAVIDFMNVPRIVNNLVAADSKTEQGILFYQSRRYENGFIYKDITFQDKGRDFHFTERVRALELEDFQSYFEEAGLQLVDIYGNYTLDDYHPETSERLIMVIKK